MSTEFFNTIGVFISIIATVVGFLTYLAARTRSSSPGLVVSTKIINSIIIFGIIIIVETTLGSLLTSGSGSTAIPNLVIRLSFGIIAVGLSSAFIIYQIISQTSRNTQLKKDLQDTEAEYAKKLRELKEKFEADHERLFREAVRNDWEIAHLPTLHMGYILSTVDAYVNMRVQEETPDQTEPNTEKERDPNKLLQEDLQGLSACYKKALDPADAIRRFKHCVILGDPGAGKTTLLKHLVLKSAAGELPRLPNLLPLYIELNALASSQQINDLLDFASTRWSKYNGFPKGKAHEYIEEKLKAGKVLLLLDALDETVIGDTSEKAEATYEDVVKAIMQIVDNKDYGQVYVVVTTRKAAYQRRTPLKGFTKLEVLNFRPEDIEKFVKNWFKYHPEPPKEASAADLNARLERNLRIKTLAANPLLLSVIVFVYQAKLELPDSRAKLYEECLETLLTGWDTSRDVERESYRIFTPEYKRQLLGKVAWHFHERGSRDFPRDHLLDIIAQFLQEVRLPSDQKERVLEEIATANGLLKEHTKNLYRFLYLAFQEYFAAQQAIEYNLLNTLLEHRGDSWWEEVILLYAALTPDASRLLQKLLGQLNGTSLQEDIFYTNLFLAGRCLAARPTVREPSLREEVISRLFDTLTKTPYSLSREQVAKVLAEIGGTDINTSLVNLLSNEQCAPEICESIADALSKLGEHSVAPSLLQLLSNSQINLSVRQSIANTLGKLGERSIALDLLQLLSNPQLEQDLSKSIAEALGLLGERSVVPNLLELLSNPQFDPAIGWSIAKALGTLGECSVVPDLVHLLSNPQIHPRVREYIADALGTLGERSVAHDLVHLLSNPQIELPVREHITNALSTLGEHSVVPDLLRLLSNPKIELPVRWRIANALGKLGDRSVAHDLLQLLDNPQIDSSIRTSIVDALGMLGDRSVAHDLLQLLDNPQIDSVIHWRIVEALGRLGEHSVILDLLQLLSNPQIGRDQHKRIVDVLGTLGESSVARGLLPLLSNKQIHFEVRMLIADALGKLGEHSVIPELLQQLWDPQTDYLVRKHIVNAIERLADSEATVRALEALLQTSDIADDIYHALWIVSRRAGVRVLITDKSIVNS